jgi:hypothetical protein
MLICLNCGFKGISVWRRAAGAAALITALASTGCGGSGASNATGLTPDGGAYSPIAGVDISAAQGAVQSTVSIYASPVKANKLPPAPGGTLAVAGTAFTLNFGPYNSSISTNITLTLQYSSLPAGETTTAAFHLYVYDTSSSTWIPLPNNNVASDTTNSGTVSGTIADSGPNGYFPSSATYAVFDDSPAGMTVPLAKPAAGQ